MQNLPDVTNARLVLRRSRVEEGADGWKKGGPLGERRYGYATGHIVGEGE